VFVLKKSWFSALDNIELAQKIISYMHDHPKACKADIIKKCCVSRQRLHRLAEEGYLFLPKPLSRQEILAKRFKNRTYVSVTVGREYGKWD
jgi:hypothetical protein